MNFVLGVGGGFLVGMHFADPGEVETRLRYKREMQCDLSTSTSRACPVKSRTATK